MKMLDLADFSKVKEDKDKTTMRHKNGHELTIFVSKLPKIHQEQLKRLKMAEGGEADQEESSDQPADNSTPADDSASRDLASDHSTHVTVNVPPSGQPASGQVQVPPSTTAVGGAEKNLNLTNPQQAAAVPAQAMDTAIKAANEGQQLDIAKAETQAPVFQQQTQNAQEIQNEVQQNALNMKANTDNFAKYMQQNPVDPMAFGHSMSVAQKITTALGLLVGGFTGGFSGPGNNPALSWLKDQQEKSIQAQLSNMGNQKNVLGAYQQLYGDTNTAIGLTKVSMNDKLIAEANTIANNLGTATAQMNRDKLVAQLQNENAKQLLQSAWIAQGQKYQNQPPAVGQVPSAAAPNAVPAKKQPFVNGAGPMAPVKASFGPDSADQTGVYNIQPILKSNASNVFNRLSQRAQGGDPVAAARLAETQKQYGEASNVDQVLAQARDVYSNLAKNATAGGWTAQNIAPQALVGAAGAIPLVGKPLAGALAGVGSLAGEAVSAYKNIMPSSMGGTEKGAPSEFERQRNFDAYNTQLGDLLKRVYGEAGYAELGEKANGIKIGVTDTPANITAKMKTFEALAKSKVTKNMLKDAGMVN